MVDMLRMYGFMGLQEYSRIIDVLRDLPQLYVDSDLRFFLDARIFNFLARRVWDEEQPLELDIFLFRIYEALIDDHGIRSISRPYRPTLYYRYPNAVTGV